ncbi:FAD binding domain-containing protein [Curtobacterium sp. S6]|uniref:FAD binding domain-containing protein n=1 Tax=Curtobacterium sp. S6 TaxID=1479623 RepID=UPI0005607405|nr:FAD binding domain-containing protein [Curtobacterium sp. S6]
MDMTCVDAVLMTSDPEDWRPGDSWLAGGTVLYSYGTDISHGPPTRLLDITDAGWEPLTWKPADGQPAGLEIAATCRIADVYAFPYRADAAGGTDQTTHEPLRPLPGLDLFRPCCDSFVASWKIWHLSTIGGNVATALPAGPMTSLLAGLDAVAELWGPGGIRRTVPVAELVVGEAATVLTDGELIRGFRVPLEALRQDCAFRRISLTEKGRSAALLIGRRLDRDTLRLVITASTRRPHVVDLPTGGGKTLAALHQAIEESVPAGEWHDDIHGSPTWRRAMTHRLAAEILAELFPETSTGTAPASRPTGDITMIRSTS